MKPPIHIIKSTQHGSKEWEILCPYFDKVWLEIDIYKRWCEFRIKMIYTPHPDLQVLLGSTDVQEIFVIGVYLPFLK